MRKILQHFFSLLILFTVSGFGLMNHASAMPTSMHQLNQDGSSHSKHSQSSSTGRCVTLCTSAVVSRDDKLDVLTDNEDEDNRIIPFYVLAQYTVYDDESTKVALAVAGVKPPPKVPIYILINVFRV